MEVNGVLLGNFKKWLQTLGYAESTVYGSVNYIRDFFFYLKSLEIKNLEQITKATIKDYYNYLQIRKNKRQTGSLSQNYIISNINALKRFSRYLQITEKAVLEIDIQIKSNQIQKKTILSKAEIKSLYKSCENNNLGIRDRAMLDIYYGCGLRRSEGIGLDVKDVLLKQKLIYIRKGKGYRERYVPITETVKEYFETYINVTRNELLNGKKEEALLISYRGKRMTGNGLLIRLSKLLEKVAINKQAGLHTLRHSIATHLLQSGMSLEDVSRFLGHASLESTQIYTHLANE
jgi:integrase/recombinase XerD